MHEVHDCAEHRLPHRKVKTPFSKDNGPISLLSVRRFVDSFGSRDQLVLDGEGSREHDPDQSIQRVEESDVAYPMRRRVTSEVRWWRGAGIREPSGECSEKRVG